MERTSTISIKLALALLALLTALNVYRAATQPVTPDEAWNYDRFIGVNPFVARCFPNFDAARHCNLYPELAPQKSKRFLEVLLRIGPIQIVERLSRRILGRYLGRKVRPESDVQLDARRLKLHIRSHKQDVLNQF